MWSSPAYGFEGNELFETVLVICIRSTSIYGNKNHRSSIAYFMFSIPSNYLIALGSSCSGFFYSFQKINRQKRHNWVYVY